MFTISPRDSAAAPPADDVVAMLVHQAPRQTPPAHRAVLYETASRHTAVDELASYEPVVSHAARLGADALLLGGVLPDPRDPATAAAVRPVLRRAARLGLQVVASIRPSTGWEMSAGDLIDRADAWHSLGADGVDVGLLRPHSPEIAAARDLAEHLGSRSSALWCAAATGDDEADVALALSDGPAPLLRHDRLWQAGWDAHALRDHITRSVRAIDTARAPLVWSFFSVAAPTAPRRSTEGVDEAGAYRRYGAAIAAMLALPGALVIRQGEEVALPFADEDDSPGALAAQIADATSQQSGTPGSLYEAYRTALRLRRDKALATGSLSWVQHELLPPSATFAFLVRDVLVVMVLGDAPVALAVERPPLHASAPVEYDERAGVVAIPADTTAWLALGAG